MRHRRNVLAAWAGAAVLSLCCAARAAGPSNNAELLEQAPPAPTEFAMVYSAGYGTVDHMPKDEAGFEDLLKKLKDGGYNTIHCVYRDWRIPLCRKHGVKMMIDVLAWKDDALTDIRRDEKQRANVKAICEQVRHEPAVWGYNLWNERLDYFGRPGGKGINDYLAMLKAWDPTHPVWAGTYRNYYPQHIAGNPGVFGYYDYHWRRGMHWHFALLEWYQPLLRERGAWLGRWIYTHDYHRNLYTLNTSIAYGLKVCIWFLGGPWDARTGKWNRDHHFCRIGREMRQLYPELMKIGRPVAVYSTPTTKTADNRDKAKDVPKPLRAIPADHWAQVRSGEAVLGFFRHNDGGDAIYVANHNAFAAQRMVIELGKGEGRGPLGVSLFGRESGQWRPLKLDGNAATFDLGPAGGELLRVTGRAAEKASGLPSGRREVMRSATTHPVSSLLYWWRDDLDA